MNIHDPDYRFSSAAAEDARYDAFMAALPPPPPVISLVKTKAGKRAVTGAMVNVIEARIASGGEITEGALKMRFTPEEIEACYPDAIRRIRPSIRALAAAV